VGNLSFDVTRDELIQAFSAAGKVVDAKVPTDRETGRPRGFAFVEFESEDGAQKSISLLNGKDLKGRPLRVNEAENRPPRPPGSAPGGGFRPPGGGFRPSGGPGGYRPSGGPGGYRNSGPPPMFPPPGTEFDGKGEGRGRKFKTKTPKKNNQRRRKDDVSDDEY
jgi:RNA recognition motif-containing protein